MTELLNDTQRTRREPDFEATRLYAEYGDKLFRYCLGQLRSREEAEDAVQNTFLRVCTSLRKGVVPEFEAPWLYKIAHNVCLSRRLGSSRRARFETPADLELLGDRAAAYTPDTDELFGLDDALADMPPNLRRPLLMREWHGMSYTEIADSLGVSHSAVETLIFRARRHLAQALTGSAKKSGRAIASVFNLRWLFNALKGVGGGVGGAGMAAAVAGLAVAIVSGVAIDLAVQSATASRSSRSVAAQTLRAGGGSAGVTVRSGSETAGGAQSPTASDARGVGGKSGGAGLATQPGSASAPSTPLSGSSQTPGGSSPVPGTPSSRTAASSARSSQGAAGSGSSLHRSTPKPPPPSFPGVSLPSLPLAPSLPDPGSLLPPVSVPVVPDLPPSPDLPPVEPPPVPPPPDSLPPVPPVPPVPPPPPVPPVPPPPPLPPLPPLAPVGPPADGTLP